MKTIITLIVILISTFCIKAQELDIVLIKKCKLLQFSIPDTTIYADSVVWNVLQLCDTCSQSNYNCLTHFIDTSYTLGSLEYEYRHIGYLAYPKLHGFTFDSTKLVYRNYCREQGWKPIIDSLIQQDITIDISAIKNIAYFFVQGVKYTSGADVYLIHKYIIVINKKKLFKHQKKVVQCKNNQIIYTRDLVIYSHTCNFQKL